LLTTAHTSRVVSRVVPVNGSSRLLMAFCLDQTSGGASAALYPGVSTKCEPARLTRRMNDEARSWVTWPLFLGPLEQTRSHVSDAKTVEERLV
jgi:hypothetical protein